MTQKIFFPASIIAFLLFLGAGWYGWQSVHRQLLLMEMRNYYDVGQKAVRQHDYVKANARFRSAMAMWEKASRMPGFMPVENGGFDGYLTAGNSYRMMRRLRRAFQCYKEGLQYDPNSINLLTAAGGLAYAMGDYETALPLLEKSARICPLNKRWRAKLEKLQARAHNPKKPGE